MPPARLHGGAGQATAAHARARSAQLLSQLLHSALFKVTAGLGVITLILGAPTLFGHAPLGWFGLFRAAFSIALFIFLVRLVFLLATETLWLLRNRLILAYVFMGVVPVLLIAGMLAIGAYMFYGQYASYLLLNELNQHTHNVGAVNSLTVRELDRHPNRVDNGPELSRYYASYYFPRGYGGVRSFFFSGGKPVSKVATRLGMPPSWVQPGFVGLITRNGHYAIASFGATRERHEAEQVLTLYALSVRNLDTLAKPLGRISLGLGFNSTTGVTNGKGTPTLASQLPLRAAHSVFDIRITSFAFIPVSNWKTGKSGTIIAAITTRPTLLNDQLFSSLQVSGPPTQGNRLPLLVLGVVGVGFLIIELFSFVAGIRLTRTITGAVNDLYVGTEHINRGQFDYRIPVRRRDQLAALSHSFNTMTESIERLLAEQREKQSLENELMIAHEVQIQLFPRIPPRLAGLEMAGRCLPARVVSGDYFDFQQLSPSSVSLALGDISGKGISAALLMATIVAAVRAYQPSLADRAVAVAAGGGGNGSEAEADGEQADPVRLLERLNHQLYHSTPPEKYVTLFYAVYDAKQRELRYTNAGHLPPAVLGPRGVRRLDRGGMVAGLFEAVSFELGRIPLERGDLLAAWSDGVTEPENEYGVEFGETRLLQMLELNRSRPLSEILDTVLHAVRDWSGAAEQSDDITLVLARVAE
ncbi:MAG: PP2C family protein-serine/threonine phosphatase [Terriglobales bacterium]